MPAQLTIRFAILATCLGAVLPAGVGVAQDVIFFDDLNAAAAQPMQGYAGQPATAPMGRPMQAARIPAGMPMPSALTPQQAAQAVHTQPAPSQPEQPTATSRFGKLASGFKGLFTRDEPSEQTAPPAPRANSGVVQAAFTPGARRSGSASRSRRPGNNLNLRQGDQRHGLLDMAFGGAAAPAPPQATAKRPTASANQTRVANRGGSTLKSRQRGSSTGPATLPKLSHTPAPSRTPAPLMASAPTPRTKAPATTPGGSARPSDGVVMISDESTEPSEPMVVVAADEQTEDEPFFFSDADPTPAVEAAKAVEVMVSDDEPEVEAEEDAVVMIEDDSPALPLASAPVEPVKPAAPAPMPLVIENPQASLPVVVSAPKPQPVAAPQPIKTHTAQQPTRPQPIRPASPQRVAPRKQATVAVLPNPVKAAESQPKQPSARAAALLAEAHYLAQDASSEEEFTRVVRQCRHVLAIDESKVAVAYSNELASWALNKRGELKADLGMTKEAMADFDEAVNKDAGQWRAIHNRGVLMAQAGDFSTAFDAFNKTIELNPEFAKAYSNRASLYVQAGEFATALDDYKRAISLDPDLVIAHKGRGRVCHVLGKLEVALQHFEAAAILSPEDAGIATCRADLLVDMGRYAQAAGGYLRAIEIDSQDAIAYRNLAWLQATCPDASYRDGQRAVKNASLALELLEAEDDISLDTLAAAQATAGDFASAVETIKQAIALAPSTDQGEYAERLELYEQEKPFRSLPAGVRQASFDNGAGQK